MGAKKKPCIVIEDLSALVPAGSQVVLQLPGLGAIPLAGFVSAGKAQAIQISLQTNQVSDLLVEAVNQGQQFATGTITVSTPRSSKDTVLSLSDVKVTEHWTVDPPEGGFQEIFTLAFSHARVAEQGLPNREVKLAEAPTSRSRAAQGTPSPCPKCGQMGEGSGRPYDQDWWCPRCQELYWPWS
jgi:hypothetical protein